MWLKRSQHRECGPGTGGVGKRGLGRLAGGEQVGRQWWLAVTLGGVVGG